MSLVPIAQGGEGLRVRLGLEAVFEDFDIPPDKLAALESRIRQILQHGTLTAFSFARIIVPVKTGFLRSTIFAETNEDLSLDLGATASYSAWVEYGTSRMAAQPYIVPTLESIAPEIQAEMDVAIQEFLAELEQEEDPGEAELTIETMEE